MFSTATNLTATPIAAADIDIAAASISEATAAQIQSIKRLANAGELSASVARRQIAAIRGHGSRGLARLTAVGSNGAVTTLELETWHGDAQDPDTHDLRADLKASGLL